MCGSVRVYTVLFHGAHTSQHVRAVLPEMNLLKSSNVMCRCYLRVVFRSHVLVLDLRCGDPLQQSLQDCLP